jgi:hypothetical protein
MRRFWGYAALKAEIYMKSVVPRSRLGSEFDDFLFTRLGEDPNGLPLSVLSLLARMNLDPWQEAGNLAGLPVDAAAERLTLAFDGLTDPALRAANTQETVLRLLALLPPPRHAGAIAAPVPGTRVRTILFITSAILLVGSQLFGAHRYAPAATVAGPAAPPVPSQLLTAPPAH